MKTPHAILIGLSLIAAAIFFKDTAVKPAHAFGGPDHITCGGEQLGSCVTFKGDVAYLFSLVRGANNYVWKVNWRTGQQLN